MRATLALISALVLTTGLAAAKPKATRPAARSGSAARSSDDVRDALKRGDTSAAAAALLREQDLANSETPVLQKKKPKALKKADDEAAPGGDAPKDAPAKDPPVAKEPAPKEAPAAEPAPAKPPLPKPAPVVKAAPPPPPAPPAKETPANLDKPPEENALAPEAPVKTETPPQSKRWIGWAAAGTFAATALGAGLLSYSASERYNDKKETMGISTDELKSEQSTAKIYACIAAGAGVTAVATVVGMIVTGRAKDAKEKLPPGEPVATTARLTVGPSFVGVGGTFR